MCTSTTSLRHPCGDYGAVSAAAARIFLRRLLLSYVRVSWLRLAAKSVSAVWIHRDTLVLPYKHCIYVERKLFCIPARGPGTISYSSLTHMLSLTPLSSRALPCSTEDNTAFINGIHFQRRFAPKPGGHRHDEKRGYGNISSIFLQRGVGGRSRSPTCRQT